MFFKKNVKKEEYTIAFCNEPNLSSEFSHDYTFSTYEDAKNTIFSYSHGWGKVIKETQGDKALIDGDVWLIPRKK